MPCFSPINAFYTVRDDGKKSLDFSRASLEIANKSFYMQDGRAPAGSLAVPCNGCIGCKLQRSHGWAVRVSNEASLYDDNSFITLTFAPEHLPRNGSLDRKYMKDFMARTRYMFDDRVVRSFYCGEYGELLGRPHYHAGMLNLDFPDREYWKTVNGQKYYVSDMLRQLWPYGHSVIGDLTFESAAYIARYCTKKITGKASEAHYQRVLPETGEVIQLLPEFCQASLKPGIGRAWFDKYGLTDVYPRDEVIVRGVRCKPPRYYDKLLEEADPEMFRQVKAKRDWRREFSQDDNLYRRLIVKERCQVARMKLLVRNVESAYA